MRWSDYNIKKYTKSAFLHGGLYICLHAYVTVFVFILLFFLFTVSFIRLHILVANKVVCMYRHLEVKVYHANSYSFQRIGFVFYCL